jgi:hypothetical protein
LRIQLCLFLYLLTFVSNFFGNSDNKVRQIFILEVIVRWKLWMLCICAIQNKILFFVLGIYHSSVMLALDGV